jgi:hypothetical protein
VIHFLASRSQKKQATPLSERMVVLNGTAGVRITVSGGRDAGDWEFRWSEISHYSHAEGHFWNSDAILLALRGNDRMMAIPTEARGAREFFETLVRRFPRPRR